MRKKPLKSRFEILQQGKNLPDTLTPDTLTDETLLTRKQAAALAGCSVRTLIKWIDERGLREVKHGGFSRIRKGELDRFLDGGDTDAEGEENAEGVKTGGLEGVAQFRRFGSLLLSVFRKMGRVPV